MSELKITLFENDPKYCLVNGEKVTVGFAKVKYGDWDKLDDYHETIRRRNKGILNYTFSFKTDVIKTEKKKTAVFDAPAVEEEFPMLNIEEPAKTEEKQEETKQCKGLTKAGKQCKREALDDSDFCALHKE